MSLSTMWTYLVDKLNAAEWSADHIASLCAEIRKRWTANTHFRNMSTWTCPFGAAKVEFDSMWLTLEQSSFDTGVFMNPQASVFMTSSPYSTVIEHQTCFIPAALVRYSLICVDLTRFRRVILIRNSPLHTQLICTIFFL